MLDFLKKFSRTGPQFCVIDKKIDISEIPITGPIQLMEAGGGAEFISAISPEAINVLLAAEEMDRWIFKSSGSKRFRRLVADGMPARKLHEALKALDDLEILDGDAND